MESYDVALSYSNVQHQYKLPIYFILTVIKAENVLKISKFLPVNSEREEHTLNDIIIPYEIKYDLKHYFKYIKCKLIYKTEYDEDKKNDYISNIFMGYYKLIDEYLAKGGNINTCYIRAPIDEDENELEEKCFLNQFKWQFYNFNIVYMNNQNSSGFMDLTRSLINDEFKPVKYKNLVPLNIALKKNRDDIYQIIRYGWNRISVNDYNNNFIGNPYVLIYNKDEYMKYYLESNMDINFYMINRYCIGPHKNIDENLEPCLNISKRKPFGKNTLNRHERCSKCDSINSISFLYKNIDINKKIDALNAKILENIVLADYVIYVSIYHDLIKIGRSLLSRSINRLIEESAYQAVVYYPIKGFEMATKIEKMLYEYLKNNLDHNNIKTSVTMEDKLKTIFNRNNTNIIKSIKKIIMDNTCDELMMLNDINVKQVDLSNNYFIPKYKKYDVFDSYELTYIKGKINGIVGGLIFIDNMVIDLNKIVGYLGVIYE